MDQYSYVTLIVKPLFDSRLTVVNKRHQNKEGVIVLEAKAKQRKEHIRTVLWIYRGTSILIKQI